ncbi:MAG: AMP-binding protein, partial [Thiotrichales bacterium]|nr:AMP-binding protein [Thiotrichales bacterium]
LKGVMFDTRVIAAVNRGFVDRYALNENDRILGGSPLGHAVGFTHALRMALTIGGSIVLQQQWEPGEAIELIRRERCTYMAAATPFLMDIIGHPALAQAERLPSLRLFLCGGASIPEQLARDAGEALPHTFTSPLWGMTECGGVTTCPFDAPAEKRHTTDGKPCGGMELKVVDASGTEVPRGLEGELLARGPMMAGGYFGRDDLTRESFLPDGFFRTGDQARMDEDGYIKITGRIKDLIIRGGVNIAPVEIESVLFAHPKVANAAVVGMPDPRLGERICAYVILDVDAAGGSTLTVGEVQTWMQEAGLAKPKWPERIEVVDTFPMTASGKVQKFRLREWIAARLEAETGCSS